MDTIAFLYPGQGSQRVGMGAELRREAPELFERYLSLADAGCGLPITQYCLEGPIEALTETHIAQPALFALSLALTDYARQIGLRPDLVAGHSLGEYTAAVVSGALSVEDGMGLVGQRGRFMADVQAERPGAMAAVIGLPIEHLRILCDRAAPAGAVTLANLNTPTQIVVSGDEAGVETLLELARRDGAEKAVQLKVGAAFHSLLMAPVQMRLGTIMETIAWSDPHTPLVANVSGEILTTGVEVHQALVDQIVRPIHWVTCVETMLRAGCSTFLELGSGRVLTGLVRQINLEVDAGAADSPQKIRNFAKTRMAPIT